MHLFCTGEEEICAVDSSGYRQSVADRVMVTIETAYYFNSATPFPTVLATIADPIGVSLWTLNDVSNCQVNFAFIAFLLLVSW